MINKGLTTVSNMFCNLNLTDMEPATRFFERPSEEHPHPLRPVRLRAGNRHEERQTEVPHLRSAHHYHGRSYEEGKKIGWKDGLRALAVIFKFWLIDDLYAAPMAAAFSTISPHTTVSELDGAQAPAAHRRRSPGGGRGNREYPGRLMARRMLYMAAEKDPLHLHALRNRFLRTPNVAVRRIDPEVPADLAGLEGRFDTVLCLNVLEYLDDPGGVLDSLRSTLKTNGALVVLVPCGPRLFGTLDRSLGHKRRYSSRKRAGCSNPMAWPWKAPVVSTRSVRRPGGPTAGCSVPETSTSWCEGFR